MNHPSAVNSAHASLPTHSFHTHPLSKQSNHRSALEHIEWLLKVWLPKYALTYISETGEQISVGNLVSQINTYERYSGSACHPSSCSTVDCSASEPSCQIETNSVTEVDTLIDESSQIKENTMAASSSLTESNALIETRSLVESNSLIEPFSLIRENLSTQSHSPAASNTRTDAQPRSESGPRTAHTRTQSHNHIELSSYQIDPRLDNDSQIFGTDPGIRENKSLEVDRLGPGNFFLNLLRPIFMDWGIDLYHVTSDEITYKIHELMIVTRSLTGTVGKKTTVVVLKELYPARRKYFPYASGYCPSEFWPGNIRYCDPSHLNREERFALLIWAYANPDHNMETIITAHKILWSRHNIVIRHEAETVIYKLRKAIENNFSAN